MGASESTAKSNGTKEEEEERQQRRASNIAAAVAGGVAVAGVAAWGISRMLSDDTDSQQKQDAIKFRPETSRSYFSSSNNSSGRFKMETSRSCKSQQGPGVNRGPSGFGGILRDGRGNLVKVFHGFIADIDSLTAEFHGILKGLQLLDKLGHVDSILESDYEPALDWINEERSYPDHSEAIDEDCWKIINECKRLKNKNNIEVDYRPRESKNCVYKLARIAISKGDPYVEIETLPDEIS